MHPLTNNWYNDEPNIVLMRKSYRTSQRRNKTVNTYDRANGGHHHTYINIITLRRTQHRFYVQIVADTTTQI